MSVSNPPHPPTHLFAAIAVALCGAVWGVFWLPLHWLEGRGVGGGWTSFVFNVVSMLAPLPFLLRRAAWDGFVRQAPAGLLLGTAFSMYSVSLVMTDVLHAILLFYLTPVWSTLAARVIFGTRLTGARMVSIACGAAGMALILGVTEGLPLPRNAGTGWRWCRACCGRQARCTVMQGRPRALPCRSLPFRWVGWWRPG